MTEFYEVLVTTFAEVSLVKRSKQRRMNFFDPQKAFKGPAKSKFIFSLANDMFRSLLTCSDPNKTLKFLPAFKHWLQVLPCW